MIGILHVFQCSVYTMVPLSREQKEQSMDMQSSALNAGLEDPSILRSVSQASLTACSCLTGRIWMSSMRGSTWLTFAITCGEVGERLEEPG